MKDVYGRFNLVRELSGDSDSRLYLATADDTHEFLRVIVPNARRTVIIDGVGQTLDHYVSSLHTQLVTIQGVGIQTPTFYIEDGQYYSRENIPYATLDSLLRHQKYDDKGNFVSVEGITINARMYEKFIDALKMAHAKDLPMGNISPQNLLVCQTRETLWFQLRAPLPPSGSIMKDVIDTANVLLLGSGKNPIAYDSCKLLYERSKKEYCEEICSRLDSPEYVQLVETLCDARHQKATSVVSRVANDAYNTSRAGVDSVHGGVLAGLLSLAALTPVVSPMLKTLSYWLRPVRVGVQEWHRPSGIFGETSTSTDTMTKYMELEKLRRQNHIREIHERRAARFSLLVQSMYTLSLENQSAVSSNVVGNLSAYDDFEQSATEFFVHRSKSRGQAKALEQFLDLEKGDYGYRYLSDFLSSPFESVPEKYYYEYQLHQKALAAHIVRQSQGAVTEATSEPFQTPDPAMPTESIPEVIDLLQRVDDKAGEVRRIRREVWERKYN